MAVASPVTVPCSAARRQEFDVPLTRELARERLREAALAERPVGAVGLELEGHLVDLARPAARVPWLRTSAAVAALPPLPGGSIVTLEPGGQVELSGPPAGGVVRAVASLQADEAVLRGSLGERGLGLAALGADPARPAQRVNPAARYEAMEAHFAATGEGEPGRAMMCSTAALQLNLEAGPASGWTQRVALAHRLGPVLVAVSACSPLLAGRATGWRSSRQQVWGRLDAARCGPLPGRAVPAEEWATYALQAPVLLVRTAGGAVPVRRRVPFDAWLAGDVVLADRRPTAADLDYHLTTLFPPVRLRGFLELRYLDAVPRRWWPGLAVLAVTLLDDPVAADEATDATAEVAGRWAAAARLGLGDAALRRAAVRCGAAALAALAVPGVPASLRADVEAWAELVDRGRSPGDDLLDAVRRTGPLAALTEAARADA